MTMTRPARSSRNNAGSRGSGGGSPTTAKPKSGGGASKRPPQAGTPTKERITLYLDPDVIDILKKDGSKGWHARTNAALRKALDM